jgi:hypothetical protein
MLVGETGIEEPMWVYLSFQKRVQYLQRFSQHPAGIREISGVTLTTRVPLGSSVSEKIVKSGILKAGTGMTPLLEMNSMANSKGSAWTSGRTCRSFFNCDFIKRCLT